MRFKCIEQTVTEQSFCFVDPMQTCSNLFKQNETDWSDWDVFSAIFLCALRAHVVYVYCTIIITAALAACSQCLSLSPETFKVSWSSAMAFSTLRPGKMRRTNRPMMPGMMPGMTPMMPGMMGMPQQECHSRAWLPQQSMAMPQQGMAMPWQCHSRAWWYQACVGRCTLKAWEAMLSRSMRQKRVVVRAAAVLDHRCHPMQWCPMPPMQPLNGESERDEATRRAAECFISRSCTYVEQIPRNHLAQTLEVISLLPWTWHTWVSCPRQVSLPFCFYTQGCAPPSRSSLLGWW